MRSRTLVALLLATCGSLGSEPGHAAPDPPIEVDATLTIWADLMPTFPPAGDPIHALIRGEFRNLLDQPLVIRLASVTVRSKRDGHLIDVFRVEPVTDWDGRLPPGGSARGEWAKTNSVMRGTWACEEPVVGALKLELLTADGARLRVLVVHTDTTPLQCVY